MIPVPAHVSLGIPLRLSHPCRRPVYVANANSPTANLAASSSKLGNRWPYTSKVIWIELWPSRACSRLGVKPCSIAHEAKKCPDADLLAVCAQFMATDAEVQAWNRGERPEYADDAVSDRLMDRWHDLAWQIEGIPAHTAAEISAKARVAAAALYSVRTPDGTFDGVEETLALSLRSATSRGGQHRWPASPRRRSRPSPP